MSKEFSDVRKRMEWVRSHKKKRGNASIASKASTVPVRDIKSSVSRKVRAKSVTNVVHAIAGSARTIAGKAKAIHDSTISYARDWYQDHTQEQQRQGMIARVHSKHTHPPHDMLQGDINDEETAALRRQNELIRKTTTSQKKTDKKKSLVWRNSYDRDADETVHGTPSRVDRTFLEDVREIPSRHDAY